MVRPNLEQMASSQWWEENTGEGINYLHESALEDGYVFSPVDTLVGYKLLAERPISNATPESSGGSCEYYKVLIENPTTAKETYTAECNDVIESLDMTYAEANMFKEIWRSAAARTLGKAKEGHTAKRGADKIVFFAARNLIQKAT